MSSGRAPDCVLDYMENVAAEGLFSSNDFAYFTVQRGAHRAHVGTLRPFYVQSGYVNFQHQSMICMRCTRSQFRKDGDGSDAGCRPPRVLTSYIDLFRTYLIQFMLFLSVLITLGCLNVAADCFLNHPVWNTKYLTATLTSHIIPLISH